jgi:hypothetical protein
MTTKSIRTTAALVAATFIISFACAAKEPVVPSQAKFRGKSYAEWSAAWFQWAINTPVDHHPALDESGVDAAVGQSGNVFFLTGVFNASGTVVRQITVKPGTALFFPVLNVDCSTIEDDPWHGDNEAELRECAAGHMDQTSEWFAEVDGQPVSNVSAFRVQSPVFDFNAPEDNILGVPGGGSGQAVSDGIYLMLRPLPAGQHTVRFGGTFDAFDFTLDITYHITVAR